MTKKWKTQYEKDIIEKTKIRKKQRRDGRKNL